MLVAVLGWSQLWLLRGTCSTWLLGLRSDMLGAIEWHIQCLVGFFLQVRDFVHLQCVLLKRQICGCFLRSGYMKFHKMDLSSAACFVLSLAWSAPWHEILDESNASVIACVQEVRIVTYSILASWLPGFLASLLLCFLASLLLCFLPSFLHSSIHSFIHSFLHSFVSSVLDSFIDSVIP